MHKRGFPVQLSSGTPWHCQGCSPDTQNSSPISHRRCVPRQTRPEYSFSDDGGLAAPQQLTYALSAAVCVGIIGGSRQRRWRSRRSLLCALKTGDRVHGVAVQGGLSHRWERAFDDKVEGEEWSSTLRGILQAPGDVILGSVRFEQVSRPQPHSENDLLLYIPDVDFSGVYGAPQFPGLCSDGYELWRCFVRPEDSPAFDQLVRSVASWVRLQSSKGRRVILLGESFGALLALAAALRLKRALKGLVLVNPMLHPPAQLEQLVRRSAAWSSSQLASLLGDRGTDAAHELLGCLGRPGLLLEGGDAGVGAALSGGLCALGARSASASLLEGTLPFRLRAWLRDGSEFVEAELRRRAAKTLLPAALLLYSGEDRFADPSVEAGRLKRLLEPRCPGRQLQVLALQNVGHEALADAAMVDCGALIRSSPIGKPRDYVSDFKFPSIEEVETGSEGVERIASLVSPVFCSTDSGGSRNFGLESVPTPESLAGRPVLLVGNHQLLGLDLAPLVREFLVQKGISVRGLATPRGFENTRRREAQANGQSADSNGETDRLGFAKWGAVPVTPRNMYRLLEQREAVLLFPGGVREALHGPGEEYELFWPEKTDFVRLAARFNAVVVPFGGVGVDDSLFVLASSGAFRSPYSSREQGAQNQEEELVRGPAIEWPVVAPRVTPATTTSPGFADRCYFSFGQPVDLLDLDPRNRPECDRTYLHIREAVRAEVDWLLEARLRDPYRGAIPRFLYESTSNIGSTGQRIPGGPLAGGLIRSFGRRAPSFDLAESSS